MLGICNYAVVLLYHRDDVLEQYLLECVEASETATSEVWSWTTLTRSTLWTWSLWRELTGSTLWSTLWTWAAKTALSRSWIAWATNVKSVIHIDDEWNCLTIGNQIIHNDTCLTLSAPARLVLTHAMLKIEYRELLRWVLIVFGWKIDISVTHFLGN